MYKYFFPVKKKIKSGATPVILAAQEAEIRTGI
jgi:hypothetical protein